MRRIDSVPTAKRRKGVLLAAACLAAVLVLGGVLAGVMKSGETSADGPIELSNRSHGVTASYVSTVPDSGATAGAAGAIAWHTEEEEFEHMIGELDAMVFRGTVLAVDGVKLASDDGTTDYRSIVSIRVDEPIRGACAKGGTVRVLSPVPLADGYNVEDNDVLELLRAGTEGIFMPVPYSASDAEELGDGRLCPQDLAPYGFPNGICYAIVEDDGALVHCDSMSGLDGSHTLDEAAAYMKDMVAKFES